MDITQTKPERKPALRDTASRLSLASRWREKARQWIREGEELAFDSLRGDVGPTQDEIRLLLTAGLFCSAVAEACEDTGPRLLGAARFCNPIHHKVIALSLETWLLHCTPIGHRIVVADGGKQITRLGICDLCGARIDYTMTESETAAWLERGLR
jgi:hypothetical protein